MVLGWLERRRTPDSLSAAVRRLRLNSGEPGSNWTGGWCWSDQCEVGSEVVCSKREGVASIYRFDEEGRRQWLGHRRCEVTAGEGHGRASEADQIGRAHV